MSRVAPKACLYEFAVPLGRRGRWLWSGLRLRVANPFAALRCGGRGCLKHESGGDFHDAKRAHHAARDRNSAVGKVAFLQILHNRHVVRCHGCRRLHRFAAIDGSFEIEGRRRAQRLIKNSPSCLTLSQSFVCIFCMAALKIQALCSCSIGLSLLQQTKRDALRCI